MLPTEPYQDLYPPHKGTPLEGESDLCASASLFLEIASNLLEYLKLEVEPVLPKKDEAGRHKPPPSIREVNQALMVTNTVLVQLQHKYFEAKRLAPKQCQFRTGQNQTHICLPHIHEKIYDEIMRLTLPIAGPIFQMPQPASASPHTGPTVRKEYVPLFLGDDD